MPLSHPKSALHISGSLQMVSHPVAPRNLSFCARVTCCPGRTALRGHLSLSDMTVGKVSHFYAISGTERSLGQREAFLSAGSLRIGGKENNQEAQSPHPKGSQGKLKIN